MTTASSTPSDMGAGRPNMPDIETLTRLANEFFAEQFGRSVDTTPWVDPAAGLDPAAVVQRAEATSGGHHADAVGPAEASVTPVVVALDDVSNTLEGGAEAVSLPGDAGLPGDAAPPGGSGPPGGSTGPTALASAAALAGPTALASAAALPGPTSLVPPHILDRLVPVPVSVPSTPYYFLGAASGPLSVLEARTPATEAWPAPPDFYFVQPGGPLATSPLVAGRPAAGRSRGAGTPSPVPFDPYLVRGDFPILSERVNGRPLVWLDNAATTQKPRAVIERLAYFYEHENSNIHRAAHELAARATDAYEAARDAVARFLGASSAEEIVFVRGTTEAINLVAKAWGWANVGRDDEIVISHLEHHANIVPWQQLAAAKGARLRVIPVDDRGQILLEEYGRLLNDRTRLVAVTHVSNVLGTVVPVGEMIEQAHAAGARVLVDGAQSVPHLRVDVQSLGADFYVFSGHKVFGPTGIGALYGTAEVLESMPPWEGGGNMIQDVTFERTLYQHPPTRFEAGTGNIADAVGLGAALDYLGHIGIENVEAYEATLLDYATEALCGVPGLRLIGTAAEKVSVLSFVLNGYEAEDVGRALNRDGIAVRAGHHCAQPILRRFGLEATVRPSLSMYNTCEEIDVLVASLQRLVANAGWGRR